MNSGIKNNVKKTSQQKKVCITSQQKKNHVKINIKYNNNGVKITWLYKYIT